MSEPIESIACTASTPAQAKVYVAMLMAEGIPARTDGDSLVDEFAASRRLMNLLGTKVLVPTKSLAAAREILQPVDIEPAELERQALAETPATEMPRSIAVAGTGIGHRWVTRTLLVLLLVVVLLLAFT